MTDPKLQNMTVTQLVDRFAASGIAQADALLYSQINKLNRLIRRCGRSPTSLRHGVKKPIYVC